mmetsp:Transcript_14470/g.27969  ORF Transcript_14470/g.27969 Transcript_14470/m.27969 type:complete len:88 (-) Transcript_14470:2052-2315(-)
MPSPDPLLGLIDSKSCCVLHIIVLCSKVISYLIVLLENFVNVLLNLSAHLLQVKLAGRFTKFVQLKLSRTLNSSFGKLLQSMVGHLL